MKVADLITLAMLSALPQSARATLKVHEWGTFTVLEGSDGKAIEWYQSPAQLIDLPPFVRRSFLVAGKSGTAQWAGSARRGVLDTIRMETPVLKVGRVWLPAHSTLGELVTSALNASEAQETSGPEATLVLRLRALPGHGSHASACAIGHLPLFLQTTDKLSRPSRSQFKAQNLLPTERT